MRTSEQISDAIAWVYDLGRHGDGLPGLARASGLTLRGFPVAGLKPFRCADSLLYSDSCSSSWLDAFFVREIAKRALDAVSAFACPLAIEAVSRAVRRRVRGVGASPSASAVAKIQDRRQPSARRLELSPRPTPLDSP